MREFDFSGASDSARSFEPVRVIAVLDEPVVYYGDGMHLDGILAVGAFRLLPRDVREALPPVHTQHAVDFDLPLARWNAGDAWGWKASAVHADWSCEGMAQVRKKPEVSKMQRFTADASLKIDGGPLKAKDMKFPTMFARVLTWYAVGDIAEIKRHLAAVPGVGKLCNHGHGQVAEWRVEPFEHDWSIERDGLLTRVMPAAYRPDETPTFGGLRPPYHHYTRQGPRIEPVFEELKP